MGETCVGNHPRDGHALGLQHNDGVGVVSNHSLRSPSFTASMRERDIMDYARQNYIAQPSGLKTKDFIRRLGPFDDLPSLGCIADQHAPPIRKETLNKWLTVQQGPSLSLVGGDWAVVIHATRPKILATIP